MFCKDSLMLLWHEEADTESATECALRDYVEAERVVTPNRAREPFGRLPFLSFVTLALLLAALLGVVASVGRCAAEPGGEQARKPEMNMQKLRPV